MLTQRLPAEVTSFLRTYIQSVEQIEILALMQRAATRHWTARDVERVLRSSEASISCRLVEFARVGVLQRTDEPAEAYSYGPKDPTVDAAAARTLELYRTRPVRVIETI